MNQAKKLSMLVIAMSLGLYTTWNRSMPSVPTAPASTAALEIPPASSLDRSLHCAGKPEQTIHFDATKRLRVRYSLTDMKVRLTWIWVPTAYPTGVVKTQKKPVPFRPTAVHAITGGARFLVAGVGDEGTTVIERWEVGPPTTKTIGIPPNVDFKLTPGAILEKTTLFVDPTASDGPVNYFLTNHGLPSTVFLQFLNSLNMYRMDTDTGSMTLALSGSQFLGPPLRAGFVSMRETDHPTKGFLYFLLEDAKLLSPPARNFVMLDAQRDGSLTGVVEIDSSNSAPYADDAVPLNEYFESPPF